MFTMRMATSRARRRTPPAVALTGRGPGAELGSAMSQTPGFVSASPDGVYAITGRFSVEESRVRVVELSVMVRPGHDDAEVTPSLLRSLGLSAIVQEARRVLAREARFWTPEGQAEAAAAEASPGPDDPSGRGRYDPDTDLWSWYESTPQALSDDVIKEARRRIKLASQRAVQGAARGRGDAFYRRIALDLVELVESGRPTPGGVLETLARIEAQRMRLPEVPVQTLRTWLRIARERQFLAPGERGRLVAIPGPLLYAEEGDR